MPSIFKSKKFWMSIAGVVAVVLSETIGIAENQTMMIAGLIMTYVFGQGLADFGKEGR